MQQRRVGSVVLLGLALAWGVHSLSAQVPAPRGELRIVDSHRYNFITIVYNRHYRQ